MKILRHLSIMVNKAYYLTWNHQIRSTRLMSIAQVLPMLKINVPGRRFSMHPQRPIFWDTKEDRRMWSSHVFASSNDCKQTIGSKSPTYTVFSSYKAVNFTTFKANLEEIKLSTSPWNLSSSRMNFSMGYIPTATCVFVAWIRLIYRPLDISCYTQHLNVMFLW
jgi:hypothetical protein